MECSLGFVHLDSALGWESVVGVLEVGRDCQTVVDQQVNMGIEDSVVVVGVLVLGRDFRWEVAQQGGRGIEEGYSQGCFQDR